MESELVMAVLRTRLGRCVVCVLVERLGGSVQLCNYSTSTCQTARLAHYHTLHIHQNRYQAAGEKLAVENFSLTDEVAKQKLTLQDINEFLTNELKARSLAAAQVREQSGSSSSCSTWPAACLLSAAVASSACTQQPLTELVHITPCCLSVCVCVCAGRIRSLVLPHHLLEHNSWKSVWASSTHG